MRSNHSNRRRANALLPLLAAAAVVLCITAPPARAAGLLLADGGFGGALEIKQHDVRVTINNGVAVTEVEQVFLNTENRVVEALYTFPVPKEASVSNFSMWIGGKEMIGEVVEKQRARQIYESYKQTRRDPGLLEQVDYKRFEMRIFPIPPGAEQRVKVTYYQQLDFDHDWATYVYPLATVSRTAAGNQTPGGQATGNNTAGKFSFMLDLKSEVPVKQFVSPSHKDQFAVVSHGQTGYWQASLEAKSAGLERDVVVAYHLERPKTGMDIITSKQGSEDGYFLLTLTAGKELEQELGGNDYVFVLDVSGSMADEGKLRISRESLGGFITTLSPDDRFEVIAFNVGTNPLFSKLTPVSAQTKVQAAEFLASQRALGGTVLRPAIESAYQYRAADRRLNVVILSDGMSEQSEQQELIELIKKRPAGTSVFCVGVGNEVNRPLLTQVAQQAGGLAVFLSQEDDFQRQSEAFRRKLARPAATGVQIAFDGIEVYDVQPTQIPNLYHGQPVRVYGRYRQGGEAAAKIKAEILGQPFEQSVKVSLPQEDLANPEIERMWAWHRVQTILDGPQTSGGLPQASVDEVVRLCKGYSIVSPYASFIVLENDAEYQRWKIERRNVTRIERDRTAQQALRERLEQLRRQAAAQAGPSAADRLATERVAPKPSAAQSQSASVPVQARPAQDPVNVNLGPVAQPADQTAGGPGIDFNLPLGRGRSGGGGGGALDPLSALAAAGLAGLGLRYRRRRAVG